MVDGFWAGGRWVAWGTQNRETPLRKCDNGHWEFKALDGLANPYMAIGAILAAGTDGILNHTRLSWSDVQGDPASLTEVQRKDLGVTEMLPSNLKEALEVLGADEKLLHLLNPVLVQRYIDVKNAEIALLTPMTAEDRRQWILERY